MNRSRQNNNYNAYCCLIKTVNYLKKNLIEYTHYTPIYYNILGSLILLIYV